MSAIEITPSVCTETKEASDLIPSPIPLHLQMDPFRKLSDEEIMELRSWYDTNINEAAGIWFKSIWEKDEWVDSVVSILNLHNLIYMYIYLPRRAKSASFVRRWTNILNF